MKAKYGKLFLFGIVLAFAGCTNKISETEQLSVDFGDLKSLKSSDLIADYSYVSLETTENSLFGSISQIEVWGDRIYILDNQNNGLYVFSMDGKYITSLKRKGNGPGEFLSLHSFWIDRGGFIYLLDRQLDRLLKYKLEDLSFVDLMVMPSAAPLSFASISNQDLFVYYYPLRQNDIFFGKQYIIADSKGTVVQKHYTASPSGKILHGNAGNFYLWNDRLRTYPHFNNEIYELNGDSLIHYCQFSWGSLKMPDQDFFTKYEEQGDLMNEILRGESNWIRLLYVYETEETLAVKYYIKRDLYLSVWNKKENTTLNVKSQEIVDDLGMGGVFPLPVGVCKDQFVGMINLFDVKMEEVKDPNLINLLRKMPESENLEDNNPILVFYRFRQKN